MKYVDLEAQWKRIFGLEWISLQEGNKAIAAVIVSEKGEIISEGRNHVFSETILNPNVAHAETEAIQSLDIKKYPKVKEYTLYAALEPCPMCLGMIVMGKIRHVVIAARDTYGGAMNLISHSEFMKHKNIQVTFLQNQLGQVQRAMQTFREILFNEDPNRREEALRSFSELYKDGVDVAKSMVQEGYITIDRLSDLKVEEVFDEIARRLDAMKASTSV